MFKSQGKWRSVPCASTNYVQNHVHVFVRVCCNVVQLPRQCIGTDGLSLVSAGHLCRHCVQTSHLEQMLLHVYHQYVRKQAATRHLYLHVLQPRVGDLLQV